MKVPGVTTSVTRGLWFLGIALFSFIAFHCSQPTRPESSREPVYAGLSDSARYVGMNTCLSCHPGIHSTYLKTGMGSSFGLATREKSAAHFSKQVTVYDSLNDFYYHPYWRNDELWFREFRMDHGDTVHLREEKISYIVGSGQHTNSHLWNDKGHLYQAPLTFYTQKGIWDLPPGFEMGNNSRFSRPIELECMSCHNAYPELQAGSSNKYLVVGKGIDCERCHGPGSIHVAEKSRGVFVDTSRYIDYSIVNPAKLSIDRQMDICQRCHIQGNAVLKDGKSFFDFKPGMRLSEVMDIYMPVYSDNQESHIMASHAERLKLSRCFQASIANADTLALRPYENALTCVSCHNPHESVRTTGREVFNTRCNSCHSENAGAECTEKQALRKIREDNCVSCHMPANSTTDIPHVTVHDHRIAVHRKIPSTIGGEKLSTIACINNASSDLYSRAEAFVNYHEKFGMSRVMLDSALTILNSNPDLKDRRILSLRIRIAFLAGNYREVITLAESSKDLYSQLRFQAFDQTPAWTAYRIAEAYSAGSNESKALIWYSKAHDLAPLRADFANKYAGSLFSLGRNKEALKVYEAITVEHDSYAPAWANRGFLEIQVNNNSTLAFVHYRKALSLDPDYQNARLNLAALYFQLGKYKETEAELRMILRRDPSNENALRFMQQIHQQLP